MHIDPLLRAKAGTRYFPQQVVSQPAMAATDQTHRTLRNGDQSDADWNFSAIHTFNMVGFHMIGRAVPGLLPLVGLAAN